MSNTKYLYVWNDHLEVRGTEELNNRANWINERILAHDWEAFLVLKELYDDPKSEYHFNDYVEYFPNRIFVYGDTHDTIELTKETFNLITDVEFECG